MEGYVTIDDKPVYVTVCKIFYCHKTPVAYWVTDGHTIWETCERPYPNLGYFYNYFVPQSADLV